MWKMFRNSDIFNTLSQFLIVTSNFDCPKSFKWTFSILDGCSYEPSICTNKDAIKDLDRQIREKKEAFQDKYDRNRVDFLKVRDATINNKEVLYYLNETFNAMNEIDEIETDINNLFMAQLPKVCSKVLI